MMKEKKMDENTRDQTHSQAAESTIAELVLADQPLLVLGKDDFVISVLRNLAARMDEEGLSPKDYAALATEARLWWTTVVSPKSTSSVGGSIFDVR